jgi:hypothetical protein
MEAAQQQQDDDSLIHLQRAESHQPLYSRVLWRAHFSGYRKRFENKYPYKKDGFSG